MKATCTSCNAPLMFSDEKFGERTSVRVRCPSCQAVVTLERPGSASGAGEAAAAGGLAEPPTVKVKRKKILEGVGPEEHVPPLPEDRRISLALLSGPNSGKVIPCTSSRSVIGRTGADIEIEDDEISRRHALIEIRDDRYFLKDLGSTNGTFVDERRITETEIFDKGEFRVGVTHCMLIITTKDDL